MVDYRIYIDESGDHAYRQLENLDQRYLGLTGVLVRQEYYDKELRTRLEQLKRDHFTYDPDSPPILVRSHIVRSKGPFWPLRNHRRRIRWGEDLLRFMESLQISIYTVVMDKRGHYSTYGSASYNPYAYCLRVLLNRIRGGLNRTGATADVMAEARGSREDNQLLQEYERFRRHGDRWLAGSEAQATYPNAIQFRRKDQNIAGLQLADLLAYPQKIDIVQRHGLPVHAPPSDYSKRLNAAVERKIPRPYGGYLLR